jgi:hypothetical protein
MPRSGLICFLILLLTAISCSLTSEHWADWKKTEKEFIDNKTTFDTLTIWLLTKFSSKKLRLAL